MSKLGRIARLFTVVLAAIVGATTMAGCGSTSSGQAATYTPAAYYQTVGGVSDCYYAAAPAEVTNLIAAGLCPANSVATVMPLSWEEEYFSYYSSPSYYNTYMPVSYRANYTHVTIVSFSKTYSKQISTASSKAVYKSSTGGTVKGSTSKLKFGTTTSGSGSGTSKSKTGTTVHGGGSGTVSSCSVSMVELADKSGASSSSHGGGSGSKSGTGSSKTGSGSKGGC